jgi:hypothetical protein
VLLAERLEPMLSAPRGRVRGIAGHDSQTRVTEHLHDALAEGAVRETVDHAAVLLPPLAAPVNRNDLRGGPGRGRHTDAKWDESGRYWCFRGQLPQEHVPMEIEVKEDAPIDALEEAITNIDWNQSATRIAAYLLSSTVPLGSLATAVLQSPLDLKLPSRVSAMAMVLATLLKQPQERSRFLRFVTGWRLEETYEQTTAAVLWFECHVPHAGSAQVQTVQARSRKSTVGIKIYGCGFDTGRRTTIEITDDSEPRKKCAYYYLEYLVHPLRYSKGREQVWGAKFVGSAGDRTQTLANCPYCSIEPDAIDRAQFIIGEHFDRLMETVKTGKTVNISWEHERSVSLSIPIPNLPMVSLPLSASASSKDVWKVHYEFAPKSFYQGYRPLGADWAMQRWAYRTRRDRPILAR